MKLNRRKVAAVFATFVLVLASVGRTAADFPEEIPFVPTPMVVVDKMLELGEVKKGVKGHRKDA